MTAAVWLGAPAGEQQFNVERLNPDDRERYAQLRGLRRRQEFAVSRALMSAVLPPDAGPTSLTHSGGWAAAALGPQGSRVGVDMEIHRARDLMGIARFAFDATEIEALEALSVGPRESLFYALWTMKEALAKALRVPLLTATRACVFNNSDGDNSDRAWRGIVPTTDAWRVWMFEPRPGVTLSMAVIGTNVPDTIDTQEWPAPATGGWQVGGIVSRDSQGA